MVGEPKTHKTKMNKRKILAIIVSILMTAITMGVAMAETVYAGECTKVELSELESLDIFYDVIGNSSNLEGLTIDLNETIANICTVKNYKPDNFTLIFFNKETEVITQHSHSSGGTKYVDKEVLIEVPNYIDREIIKEVPIESEPEIIKKTPNWVYFLTPIVLLMVLILIDYIKRLKNVQHN